MLGTESPMHEAPLVSIMMPCFNAAHTLPMAIASMCAQTYSNWEAVVVDDGSTDDTSAILDAWPDSRIRRERFERNEGRGAARQRCLEMARGEYLSFLDADDWLFDHKLAHQVALMVERPEIAVVSGVCVITDEEDEAVGLTQAGLVPGESITEQTFERLGPPPLSFPPCMIRMSAARGARFNPAFLRSQDSDFLLQVMLGKRYAVSSTPVYAYSQAGAATLQKTMEGYRYRIRSYAQYATSYPMQACWQSAKTLAKMGIYRIAGWTGTERALIERRWQPMTPEARKAYETARASVLRHVPMEFR
jgi:glycosyltransferase involved in cell wall biosynthesis